MYEKVDTVTAYSNLLTIATALFWGTAKAEHQTYGAVRLNDRNGWRVLPTELRKAVVQEREASQRPVLRLQQTRSSEKPLSPLAEEQTVAAADIKVGFWPVPA